MAAQKSCISKDENNKTKSCISKSTENDTPKTDIGSNRNGKFYPAEVYESNLKLQIGWCFSTDHYIFDGTSCPHETATHLPGEHAQNFFNTFGHRKHLICESCAYSLFAEFLCDNLVIWKFADLQAAFVIHCNTRKFMFSYSNIWFCIVKRCIYSMDAAKDTKGMNPEQLLVYQDLAVIMTNIGFLRKRHWKIITFKCSFITKLFEFVINMLVLCKEEKQICTITLFPILIIIWKWLDYFQKYKLKHFNKRSVLMIDKELTRYCKSFESNLSESEKKGKLTFMLRGLYEAVDKYEKYCQMIDKKFQELWKIRRANQKCQRLKCKVMRMDKTDWLKCSKCLAAVYCSKKCAKYDWKCGNHKKYCFKYYDEIMQRMDLTGLPQMFFKYQTISSMGTMF